MRRGRTIRVAAIGALVIAMAGPADLATAGQRGRGGASGRAPNAPPRQGQMHPHPARPSGPHRFPQQPVIPPFPNIATLSGPLPQGLNPPFVNRPNDLFTTRPRRSGAGSVFYPGIAYGGYADMGAGPEEARAAQAQPANGLLRLDITPGSAEVFVDGYYSGTADDIANRRGLILSEGPHRIEVRARGYESHTVDVRVVASDVVTYRTALDLQRPPAPASGAAANGPTTIYVVPGCYMGNVPPRRERVGSNCDVSRARVVTPQQSMSASPSRNAPGIR